MSRARVESVPVAGFALVGVAYAVAAGVAWLVVTRLDALPPMWAFAVAELGATLVIFAFSRAANNTSLYDPYWSVAPMLQAVWLWTLVRGLGAHPDRATLVLALVWLWGVRLTFNWARGWGGLGHEDWRYADFRARTGRAYWVVSLFGLHLFPTLMTGLGGLALFAAMWTPADAELGALDALASAVVLAGVALEAVADEQLRRFRRVPGNEGAHCERGLWRWSRHPNYFGEWLFWSGLALFTVADGFWWPAWVGVAAMLAMFLFASIPLAEKRARSRRPGWAAYARRTARFVPLPPRRG